MYISPDKVIDTVKDLILQYKPLISKLINEYQNGKELTFYTPIRPTLPIQAYPSFEISPPDNSDISWFATHTQQILFSCKCLVTISSSDIAMGSKYISQLATFIVSILTDPRNIQIPIKDGRIITPDGKEIQAYIFDTKISGPSYGSTVTGTIQQAEFTWEVKIMETYPDQFWKLAGGSISSIPVVISGN